jgi:glyceraldehyde 3-phosphate dehydrogenase
MPTRVAINGFGRVGRSVLRSAYERRSDIEIVAVNDPTDADVLGHLLRHDSVYGAFPGPVEAIAGELLVAGHPIRALAARMMAPVPAAA